MPSQIAGRSAFIGAAADAPSDLLPQVLVVDHGEYRTGALAEALTASGFGSTTVGSGYAALEALQISPVAAIVLDLSLPDVEGREIITRMRGFSQAPILVVSAPVPEDAMIEALDLGANDFLTKPYSTPELMARLRAATRSVVQARRPDPVGCISFDFDARKATVTGRTRNLTARETDLLRLLDAAQGELVSHEDLIAAIWGADRDATITHLRVLAWQARRKIEPDASLPRFLLVVPGRGYRLVGVQRA